MADQANIAFGNQDVIERLGQIVDAFTDLSPAMRAIGEELSDSTMRRFDTSTAPDGSRWAPNAVATVLDHLDRIKGAYRKDGRLSKRGALAYTAKKPLVASGLLQDSFRWQLIAGGQGVEVGTNRFASEWEGGAALFHFGRRDGKMPAREIVGLSADDEIKVLSIMEHFVSMASRS